MNGNLIEILQNENVQSLSGEFNWTMMSKLAPGIYYIIMQQKGKKVAVCKLVKL
jgi:hypothetical protein